MISESPVQGVLAFYLFGLRSGVMNLLRNGLALGLKKTVGKITQPINSHSRFPEYCFMGKAIIDFVSRDHVSRQLKILDVGSPKSFGLYFAHSLESEIHLTDIDVLNVAEYKLMHHAVETNAKGKALFSLHDGRRLAYADDSFDVVYSMSVVEHIGGEGGDSECVGEMVRVLKPGGLLLVTVPAGGTYLEQRRIGVAGAIRRTRDQTEHFFQRIYDPASIRKLLSQHAELEGIAIDTVHRRCTTLLKVWGHLGEEVRGLFGFLNPLLSKVLNQTRCGMDAIRNGSYGSLYKDTDIYGDWLIRANKKRSLRSGGDLSTMTIRASLR